MLNYVAGLPAFLSYFLIGLLCLATFSAIYTALLPPRGSDQGRQLCCRRRFLGVNDRRSSAASPRRRLIPSASPTISSAVIFSSRILHRQTPPTDLHLKITEDECRAGLWSGGIAVVIGILNAARMAY